MMKFATTAAPIRLEPEEIDLPRLIQETWSQILNPLRIELEITSTQECRARGDIPRLSQVCRNVLENALAVSPEGARIHVLIDETSLRDLPACRIRIRDRGPGFEQKSIDRVFEPFFTTKSRGTGLGMAIAHRIISAHQGEIVVRNAETGGAEVEIIIPRG